MNAIQAMDAISKVSTNSVRLERSGRHWLAVVAMGGRTIGAYGRTREEAMAKLHKELEKGGHL